MRLLRQLVSQCLGQAGFADACFSGDEQGLARLGFGVIPQPPDELDLLVSVHPWRERDVLSGVKAGLHPARAEHLPGDDGRFEALEVVRA